MEPGSGGDGAVILEEPYEVIVGACEGATSSQSDETASLASLRSGLPPCEEGTMTELCCYRTVNSSTSRPILLWALKSLESGELGWTRVAFAGEQTIRLMENTLVNAFADLGPAASYRGWRTGVSGRHQMWFELRTTRHVATSVVGCRGWRWVMPSEIVNEQNVAEDAVDVSIREDMLGAPGVVIGSECLSAPAQVGYYVGASKTLGYAATLGVTRADRFAPFGPGYYLDSYERAKQALSRPSPDGVCIVRYAIAPGRTTMLLGRATDPPDSAPMTKHLAAVKPLVKAAAKVRDADRRWARTCGGIGRGRLAVELSGQRHIMAPRFCVSDADSYIPLEYCSSVATVSNTVCKSSRLSYNRKHEHIE